MKKLLEFLGVMAVSLVAGAYLHECQSLKPSQPPEAQSPVTDTIHYYDTIPYLLPSPAKEITLGTQVKFLPVRLPADSSVVIPQMTDSDEQDVPDSMAVEIPIIQREYEAEEYHAWVSGYEPSLDSIFVFPRHDVVTIREPPNKQKRWGIGVFAGYGYTPQGFQPCAGISVNYTLWNF